MAGSITRKSRGFHITNKATLQIETTNAELSSIYLCCSNAGTAWSFAIQDGSVGPKIILDLPTLTAFSNAIYEFKDRVRMESGINIVTGGTTAGVIDVWVTWFS